jgi:hypothetical protein
MKSGLFRDSFLEDPWRDLVGQGRSSARGGHGSAQMAMDAVRNTITEGRSEKVEEVGDGEGEIILSSDDDGEETGAVGLGDGIVEAAKRVG